MENKYTKILLASNVVLAICVVVLFALHFLPSNPPVKVAGNGAKVAYLNLDSLLSKYDKYKTYSEDLLKDKQSAEAQLSAKMQGLQKEAEDFQGKVQKGFYTREQAQTLQQELYRKQQNLQELQQNLGIKLREKEGSMREELLKTVIEQVKEYNKKAGYDFVITNSIYSNESLDITKDVLKLLNSKSDTKNVEKK